MSKNVLTVNVPFTMPDALPYGPAVINGILNYSGYNAKTWDLSIDIYRKFLNYPEFQTFINSISIGGSNFSTVSKQFLNDLLSWLKHECESKIKKYNPEYILLSIFSSGSLDFVVPLVTIIRKLSPNSYILLGGRGLDNIEKETGKNYASFFVKHLPINCAYIGDAENNLIRVIETKHEGVFNSPPINAVDLSNIPVSNWEGYNFSNYNGYDTKEIKLPITASKGCVKQCTFCDVGGIWPKYIFRDGENVANEIINLFKTTNINKFEFTDNLINGSVSNFRKMNSVLASKIPKKIEYYGYAICRGKRETPESDFELAADAGAKLFKIGIESGSESVRKDIRKQFSDDDLSYFTKNCVKNNIKQSWLMFVGYPSETEKDFQQTLDLLEQYKEFAGTSINVFLALPMTLLSNSGFLRKYKKEYGLEHNIDKWSDFFWTSSKYPENTFDVRANRWHRMMQKMIDLNYIVESYRQKEKITEINGIQKFYEEYKNHNADTLSRLDFKINVNFNEETDI